MKLAKIRLLVATVLLVGWLSWLGYLAATQRNPVVLSRSQAMVSTHFVLAKITVDEETGLPDPKVEVVEDLRPAGEKLSGTIKVRNLKEARIAGEPEASRFRSAGPYLLMLTQLADGGGYELTPPPSGPGSENAMPPRPWAYEWNAPGVQKQFDEIVPKR